MSQIPERPVSLGLLILAVVLGLNCSRRAFSPPPVAGRSTIEGVVYDINGGPVSGATVLLCHDAVLLVGCAGQVGETTTDEKGQYSFRDIPPGEYLPAVRVSQQAVYVMQKQAPGKVIVEAVKYTVSPDQTLVIPDLRLDRDLEKLDEPPVKLVYPVSSASISDARPTLKWEPVAGAQYGVALQRVDGNDALDIQLTDHPLELIGANSITVRKDLDDGLYQWVVYVFRPNDKDPSIGSKKATAFFTVAKGPVTRH
jgi:Carboxypeptidase regulatory-like domain